MPLGNSRADKSWEQLDVDVRRCCSGWGRPRWAGCWRSALSCTSTEAPGSCCHLGRHSWVYCPMAARVRPWPRCAHSQSCFRSPNCERIARWSPSCHRWCSWTAALRSHTWRWRTIGHQRRSQPRRPDVRDWWSHRGCSVYSSGCCQTAS